MNTTKSSIFDLHSDLMKALASPVRLEIMQLIRSHELTVGQIVQMSGLRQSHVSQHLSVLREAGIVLADKRGKEIYYSVRHENYVQACDLIRSVLMSDHVNDEIGRELMDLPDNLEPTVTDPICEMKLTPSTSAFATTYNGVRHYFCGKGCLQDFTSQHQSVN